MPETAPFDAEIGALLALAKEQGLPDVEVYARRDVALTLRAYQGEIESFQRSDSVGIGVRVLAGERVGYAYTENLQAPALARALAEAAGNAQLVEGQAGSALAGDAGAMPELVGLYNPALESVALDAKIERVLTLERITREADPRIKSVPGCSYSDAASLMRIASTRGLDRHYRSNANYVFVYPIVSDQGENKTCFEITVGRDFAGLDVQELAARAVGNALGRLGAQEIKSGSYPVVFSPRAMAELLAAFSDVFSAKAAIDGKSLLAGKVGEAIASEHVTLIDDALLASGFAARPFDDEGVASRRVAVIDGGRFQTFLHNVQTARQLGAQTTGHAARGGYKGTLGVAPTNFFVQPGPADAAALYGSAAAPGPVVLIDDLQGLHAGTNAISGDFSLQAQGQLWHDGVKQHPVHNFTVAGNFFKLLADVEAVGQDLHFFPHAAYIGSPSLRVKALAIAGS